MKIFFLEKEKSDRKLSCGESCVKSCDKHYIKLNKNMFRLITNY